MSSTAPRTVATAALLAAALALGLPGARAVNDPGEQRDTALVSIAAPEVAAPDRSAIFGVTVRDLDSGAPLGGMRVVLQQKTPKGWERADEARTEPGGRAVLTSSVEPPATVFRAKLRRTAEYARARSAPVTVRTEPAGRGRS